MAGGHDWKDAAACQGQASSSHDPWHPTGKKSADALALYGEARAVCEACPVRAACLEYALGLLERTGQVCGMYGGLLPAEIRAEARRLGRPTRKAALHGSRSRYVRGCRCPDCTAANARKEYNRRHAA